MEIAINSVISFLILYLIYYYALRFIQIVFQNSMSTLSRTLSHAVYVISTPAHEFAHLITAFLCRANIQEVKLFPGKNQPGYVRYSMNSGNKFLYNIKTFFTAVAPALINIPLFIFIESKFILKINNYDISKILKIQFLFSKEGVITLILFIVLVSGIAPSFADLKGMFKGVILFCAIIFVVTYLSGTIFNMHKFNMSSLITLVLYYGEIILAFLVLNIIFHFKNAFSVIGSIFTNAVKQTFSKS